MKKQFPPIFKKMSLYLIILFSLFFAASRAQTTACNPNSPCTGTYRPIPKMHVDNTQGRSRFNAFNTAYRAWGFNKADDMAIDYSLEKLKNMVSSFGLSASNQGDSVSVFLAACDINDNTFIPGAIASDGIKKFKLILLFSPMKNKIPSNNYFTIDLTVSAGFRQLSNQGSTTLLNGYSTNQSLNLTKASLLRINDVFNHIDRDPLKGLTNTLSINYRYSFWKEYFENEVDYQKTKCGIQTKLDSVSASFTCFDASGDGLGQNQTPGLAERVNRLHIIFQFFPSGGKFTLDETDDYQCRKDKTEEEDNAENFLEQSFNTIVRYVPKDTVLSKFRFEKDTIDAITKNLQKLATNTSLRQDILEKENKLEKILGKISDSQEGSKYLIRRKLFKRIIARWRPGNPNGGGGDSGQSNP